MKTTVAKKPTAPRRAAETAAVRAPLVPNFAGLQTLMQMQNRMANLAAKLPARSMFDGIPAGASPYYFYSLSGTRR